MSVGLTWTELERHLAECGILCIVADQFDPVPIIRTDDGNFAVAAVHRNDSNQLIFDMGQRLRG